MQLDNSSFTLPNKRNAVLERLIECYGETGPISGRNIFICPKSQSPGSSCLPGSVLPLLLFSLFPDKQPDDYKTSA